MQGEGQHAFLPVFYKQLLSVKAQNNPFAGCCLGGRAITAYDRLSAFLYAFHKSSSIIWDISTKSYFLS